MKALTRIRSTFVTLWRYRPRILTLLVLAVVAATAVLSNLTFDLEYMGDFSRKSYGWPLVWRRCVLVQYGSWRTVGWYNSPPRLGGNIAMWIAIAAGSNRRLRMAAAPLSAAAALESANDAGGRGTASRVLCLVRRGESGQGARSDHCRDAAHFRRAGLRVATEGRTLGAEMARPFGRRSFSSTHRITICNAGVAGQSQRRRRASPTAGGSCPI